MNSPSSWTASVPRPDPAQRSTFMRSVKQRDTRAELVVRRIAHLMGVRYRLHQRDLPGSPILSSHDTISASSSINDSGTATPAVTRAVRPLQRRALAREVRP
ncbi:hypothetical protein [Luteimonas arsenica]|uniref:hypothetical protein n=1 Tax=Luteimonas arsenica TaxID=1586242 RepID=UPI003CCE31C1